MADETDIRIPIPRPRPGPLKPPPPGCAYPQSHRTRHPIDVELAGLAANGAHCTSIYLDTVEGMSNDLISSEGEEHHQGLARTHKLSDGSVHFFLSHSELDPGDKGVLATFRYGGGLDGEHVLTTSPLTVAPMQQDLQIVEQHPSDIVFLPDVDNADAGYLFVTDEYVLHRLTIYRWNPHDHLVELGHIDGFPTSGPTGPNFVFVDNVDGTYYLGVASNNWGWGRLFAARQEQLFPRCTPGSLNVGAFQPVAGATQFPFPLVDGPCQCKLVRDSTGAWSLLAYRSDPPSKEDGTDYVDVYDVSFAPFAIAPRRAHVHVVLRPGDTGFASTGTHYVEPSGRLLVSSSYRWAEDEGPHGTSFVSRVDELPAA
jgi:hypothetical protein